MIEDLGVTGTETRFFLEQVVWFEQVGSVLGHSYQLNSEILKQSRL